jgi:catechol 2,3-dioxygenase-like lactoylglutathione lyase family enzyme
MIKKGNSCIELFEFNSEEAGDPKRPVNRIGITHFALASDDIEEDYEHLAANGVAFNTPLFGGAPARFAYGRDPFGNVIELLEHAPEAPSGLRFD